MDCLFVQMPYTGLVRPSPALGILQAILQRDGIESGTLYADLLFAEEAGLEQVNLVATIPPHDLLGDWTFSHIAFPDFHPDDDLFLKKVYDRNEPHIECSFDDFHSRANQLRAEASAFIEYLCSLISKKRPAAVGCSSTLQQHVPSLALLRIIRECLPDITTILGGANCEADMGLAAHRSFPWVDYIVSGEADELIVPLIRQILEHGRNVSEASLPSCTFAPLHRREGYTKEDGAAPRAVVESLEQQPLPDYTDYFTTLRGIPKLDSRILSSIPVETSRGCWYGGSGGGCTFCGLNGVGKRFRRMSPEKALNDILELSDKYRTDRVQAMDNVMDPAFIREMIPELAGLSDAPKLWYEVRTNLSLEDLKDFRSANVRWIWAGIESLDDRLLGLMSKGSKAINNVRFLKACRQAGVFTGWNLMVDFPGDEDQWYSDMAGLLDWLLHLQPPRALIRLRFDRFSRYLSEPAAFDLDLKPAALYSHVYPLPQKDLADLACFFEDDNRRLHPRFSDLLSRKGIEALTLSSARWAKRFHSTSPPELTMRIENDELLIHDTRKGYQEYRLAGIESDIILACEEGLTMAELTESLLKAGHSPQTIEEGAENLIDRRLLLKIGNDSLSLPLREPIPELPRRNDYPGGVLID
jgi:ribosomal peptide maturation radical SAM protein 1